MACEIELLAALDGLPNYQLGDAWHSSKHMRRLASRRGCNLVLFVGLLFGCSSTSLPTDQSVSTSTGGAHTDGGAGGADARNVAGTATGGQLGTVADAAGVPAPDGRCGATPSLLVSPSTLPVPTYNGPLSGQVNVGVAGLFTNGAYLYYSVVGVLDNGNGFSPGLGGSFMRVPVVGGPSTTIASGYYFSAPAFTPSSVIVDEGIPYPNNGNDVITSILLDGSAATTITTLPYNDSTLAGPLTDGTYVYFGDNNGIEAVPLSGASAGSVLTLSSISPNTMGIFGQHLIFLEAQGAVYSVPLPPQANSVVTQLGAGSAGPGGLIPCGSYACWLDEEAGAVDRIDPSGGPLESFPLPAPLAYPSDIQFDGSNFYIVGNDISNTTRRLLPRSRAGL